MPNEVLDRISRLSETGVDLVRRPGGTSAYFHDEFVVRRRWLSERNYADLVALCQFCGPASSQVGMAIGVSRAGYWGACAAWAGFTLPSAAAMIIFALGMVNHGDAIPAEWLDGFKAVAVAVVAQAVWGMGRHQCTDAWRASIMAIAASCARCSCPPPGDRFSSSALPALPDYG